jgi:hypothetical protein
MQLLGTDFLYSIHGTRPAGKPLPARGPLRERQPAAERGAVGRHHANGQWAHTACSRIRIRLTEGGAYPVTPRNLRSISG